LAARPRYAATVHSAWRTFLIAALATTAALAAFGVASALAANEIAYDCKLDICLLDPANPSAVTNLTDNEGTSIDEKPVWSPDGKKVAFISNFPAGSTKNIFVMEPGAAGQGINIATQVTHFTLGELIQEAVWSPDGTRIAFVVGNHSGSDQVEVANSDGTTATPVTVDHGDDPTWAPDSGKIAYDYQGKIYVKNADGSGTATPIPGAEGQEPAWSPDGAHIAYGAKAPFSVNDLGIIPPSGGTPKTLTAGAQFIFASWSRSGAQVAYEQVSGGNNIHWRIANADGSGDHPLVPMQELSLDGPAPSWSPDGSRIVFQGYFYGGAEPHTNGVYMQNTDGSGSITTLVEGEKYFTSPDWKPNPALAPQQFIPAGGATSPLPATQKPKTVWITKRIPWTPGPDLTLIVLSVGCGGPVCNAGGQGTSRGSVAAGIRPRTSGLAVVSGAKAKKARPVVVGNIVKTKILGGQTKPVKLKLTPAGVKLLTQLGKLTIDIKLTIASPGQPTMVYHHPVKVVREAPKKKHKHG
jgi:Tol biopolymer transport system component